MTQFDPRESSSSLRDVVSRFDEDYFERFEALAEALAAARMDDAAQLVEGVAQPGSLQPTKRPAPSLRRWVAIFTRDAYTCRYCLRRTIAPPVLRAVSMLFPQTFKFHPNWKTSECDAAYLVLSTSLDHVIPVTRGGTDDVANLVTACWMCNGMKSNFLLAELPGWTIHEIAERTWSGLTEHLPAMMRAGALEKEQYLRRWADAIAAPELLPP